MTGIGGAMGAVGAGAFGMNSDFEDEAREFAWMTRLSKETGRPVWFLLTDRPTDPERWRRLMRGVHQARAEGASVTAQIAGRPVGVILGIATSMNPFTSARPTAAGGSADGRALGRGCATRRCEQAILDDPPSPALVEPAGPVHPLYRLALGPHVRDGRPARLRAARRDRASRRSPRAPTIRQTKSPTTT